MQYVSEHNSQVWQKSGETLKRKINKHHTDTIMSYFYVKSITLNFGWLQVLNFDTLVGIFQQCQIYWSKHVTLKSLYHFPNFISLQVCFSTFLACYCSAIVWNKQTNKKKPLKSCPDLFIYSAPLVKVNKGRGYIFYSTFHGNKAPTMKQKCVKKCLI